MMSLPKGGDPKSPSSNVSALAAQPGSCKVEVLFVDWQATPGFRIFATNQSRGSGGYCKAIRDHAMMLRFGPA